MASRQLPNPRALGTLTNQQRGVVPSSSTTTSTSKPSSSCPHYYARQVTDVDLLKEDQEQPYQHTQTTKFELPSDSESEDEDQAAAPRHGGYNSMTPNAHTTMMEGYESSDDEQEPAAAAVDPNSYRVKMAAMRDAGLACLDPHAAAAAAEEEARPVASQDKDWMTTQKELDELFTMQLKTRMDHVPKIDMPELLTTNGVKLYKYQKQGVQWLVHKETTNEALPPFYRERPMGFQKERIWYENTLTKRMQRERPEPIRGSILADDMGLGKTLQTIALLLSNPPEGRDGIKAYPYKRPTGRGPKAPRCTLIVSPVSVMANWMMEIDKFVNKHTKVLNVAIYQGSKREEELIKVKRHQVDVLICSYQTLAADFKKYDEYQVAMEEDDKSRQPAAKKAKEDPDAEYTPGPERQKKKQWPETWIYKMLFHRIVLDEAHIIRNGESQTFNAISNLVAIHKLCLTGTPFVNHPKDLLSLFKFLDVDTMSDKRIFDQVVIQPILQKREVGLSHLRVVMGEIALRRTKNQVEKAIQLVEKTVEIRNVVFTPGAHFDTHEMLYTTARTAFIGLLATGARNVFQNFFALFGLVLRVRQACCHGELIPLEYREKVMEFYQTEILKMGDISEGIDKEEGARLFHKLMQAVVTNGNGNGNGATLAEESHECAVCFDTLGEESAMILRTCEHVFCRECLDKIENQHCPMCRTPYTAGEMISSAAAKKAASRADAAAAKKVAKHTRTMVGRAPKIEALFEAIHEMKDDEKGVIFSQWTSYLDIIQEELLDAGYFVTRIDGSMSTVERIEAMQVFSTEGVDSEETPRFILCSLHACGTGITLTRANWVFMMDTWWNIAAENQAMDRVHRIGQSRPVKAIRFIMDGSIEERFINLQNAKEALGKGSLQKLKIEDRQRARLTCMKDLFEVGEKKEHWDGHYEDDADLEQEDCYSVGDEDEDGDLDGFIVNDDKELEQTEESFDDSSIEEDSIIFDDSEDDDDINADLA